MKIRFQDNAIRLRLKQEEVASLSHGAPLAASTRFFEGELHVEVRPEGDAIHAAIFGNVITICVPFDQAAAWAESNDEGLYAEKGFTTIAIEKDFACLHKTGDDNIDTFPNPAAAK